MRKYIECAIREIEEQSFELTKQYLKANAIQKEKNRYAIERISEQTEDITIYFKLYREKYFLGICIDKNVIEVTWVFIENSNECHLTASSDCLGLEELSRHLPFKYSKGWSKGEISNNGKSHQAFSCIFFEILPSHCYDTEEALSLLLNQLAKHKEAVDKLSNVSNLCISICKHQYLSSNAGLHLSADLIRRLSEFNLAVDIDTYIVGQPVIS